MSNAVVPINLTKTKHQVMSFLDAKNATYTVKQAPTEKRLVEQTTSSSSISSDTFKINIPSVTDLVNRRILLHKEFEITFTGTRVGPGNLLDDWGTHLSLRAQPLMNSITSLNLKINDGNVSIPLNSVLTCFQSYHYDEGKHLMDTSLSPTYPDNCQDYNDVVNTVRSPLGSWGEGDDHREKRGAFGIQVISNTPVSAVIRVSLTEPVYISPLSVNAVKGASNPLLHIRDMELNIIYAQNIHDKLLSYASSGASTFTNIGVTQVGLPSVLLEIYTYPMTVPLPSYTIYDYHSISRFQTDYSNTLAPNATVELNNSSINLNGIPSRIFLFGRKSDNTQTYQDPDCFLRIEGISVSLGNKAAMLSEASPEALYQMCMQNGLNKSFNSWYPNGNGPRYVKGLGSVICIDLSKDLGLDELTAVGVGKTVSLQIKVRFTNVSNAPINFSSYVVLVDSGICTISPGRFIVQSQLLSASDVLNSKFIEDSGDVEGGDVWGAFKSFLSNVPRYISAVLPVADKAVKIGSILAGAGDDAYGGEEIGGAVRRKKKSMKKSHRRRGGEAVGGELISRSELRNLM